MKTYFYYTILFVFLIKGLRLLLECDIIPKKREGFMERLIRIALGMITALTLVLAFSSCEQSPSDTPSDNIHNDDTPSDNTQDSIPPVDDSGDAEAPKDEECHHVDLTFAEENHKSPTCTEYGSYDKIAYCADCGEKISWETVLVVSPGHSYDLVLIEKRLSPPVRSRVVMKR